MQPSGAPIDEAGLKAAWERFTAGGPLAPELDPLIAQSWRRCADRLDPRGDPQWVYAGSRRFPLTSVQHSFLALVARPLLEDICQFIEGSGALLILTDPSACVFEMLGDPAIEAQARALGFRPGAFLDESRIGSNAFSLALAEGTPVQVMGPEHFLQAFHGLHSAAAPMHDPGGHQIGIVGLLQRRPAQAPQALGIVFAAARAIEHQLQAERCIREANDQASEFSATLDAVSEGILAWTTQGIVTHLNGQGGRLLGVKPSMIVGRPLGDHIILSEGLSRAALRGEELNDVEAGFRVDGAKQAFSVSLRVIRNRGGNPEAFILTLRPMAQVHQLVNRLLGSQARMTLADIVGQSPAVQQMRRQSLAAVNAKGGVLLVGEEGAGQNVLARAIHNSGGRAAGPFLAISCRSIPRELVIEEFLGFEGALNSGASSKFELADGGTLFIEDIDALPLEMQAVLARILESGEVVRLGGKRPIPVDVRVIASVGVRLEARIRAGAFRSDLFRLVSRFPIQVPPLRERAEDIPHLAERSLERLRPRFGQALGLSGRAMGLLCACPWPENLAGLDAALELAASRAEGGVIEPEHLPEGLARLPESPLPAPVRTIREMEKVAIVNALRAARGNHSRAAQALSISRNTLYRKMKEMGVANPERPAAPTPG
jgi:transcriptional activator for dhaKLM operon